MKSSLLIFVNLGLWIMNIKNIFPSIFGETFIGLLMVSEIRNHFLHTAVVMV